MSMENLLASAKSFEKSQAEIDATEKGRLEFIGKFPKEKLSEMTLEEYAQGTNSESFCYWLEFKNITFGVGGGNAAKFGIFKAKDGRYYMSVGVNKQPLKQNEAEKHFSKIKDSINKALKLVEEDKFQELNSLEISFWNMILVKILSIYFPEKFLPIGASKVLIRLATEIKLSSFKIVPENLVLINYHCNMELRKQTELSGWGYEKLGTFVWARFGETLSRNYYVLGSKYGENSNVDVFPQMLEKSVVSINFGVKIDLQQVYGKDKDEVKTFLQNKGLSSSAVNSISKFLALRPGDQIAVKGSGSPKGNKGYLSIVGLAEVCEKDGLVYKYDPKGLVHTINVNFNKSFKFKELELGGFGQTIQKVRDAIKVELIFGSEMPPTTASYGLNTIFYGPPGTGKTYRLKDELFPRFLDQAKLQTREEFCDELTEKMTWSDAASVVLLDLKNATVPEMSNHEVLKAKVRNSENNTVNNSIWGALQKQTKDDCENVKVKFRTQPQYFWKDDNGKWSIDEKIVKVEAPNLLEILHSLKNFTPETKSEKRYVFTTFHQSYSYEDFIEGIKPRLIKGEDDLESNDIGYHIRPGVLKTIADTARKNPDKEYAIFIDEINRGNVANIFGELITLIEEDKRFDAPNFIPAVLPYSKEEFGLPANLYLFGTMNTADRSVEALDTALRRRFSFVQMEPKPELLSQEEFACKNVNLEKMLIAINSRLEKLLDKDHCMGHSYFMTIKDKENPFKELREIFSNKILPLLQEYFYGDWGKILLVLGRGFVEKKIESIGFLSTEDYDDFEDFIDKPIYSFTSPDSWLLETFQKIYE